MTVQSTSQADPQSGPQSELSFEAALEELERLVEQMETGELSLEESLRAFERGVVLTRDCQRALKDAELRVQALTESNGEMKLTDVDPREFDLDDAD